MQNDFFVLPAMALVQSVHNLGEYVPNEILAD
jgi:hypothetical protein